MDETNKNSSVVQTHAILEFLNYEIPNYEENEADILSESLSDGIHLYQFLHSVSVTHFDLKQLIMLTDDISDNWVLKQTNLRKVVRDLELFYVEEFGLSFNDDDDDVIDTGGSNNVLKSIDVSAIAKCEDIKVCRADLILLCSYVAFAAVQSRDRSHVFVDRIMQMTSDKQLVMKELIENVLAMPPFSGLNLTTNTNNHLDDSVSSAVDRSFDISFPIESSSAAAVIQGDIISPLKEADVSNISSCFDFENHNNDNDRHEHDDTTTTVTIEDSRNNNGSDLQLAEQLKATNDELVSQLEEKDKMLKEMEKKLEQAQISLSGKEKEVEEKYLQLKDEQSVAQAQAQKLRKLEATIVSYKEKLENVGVMNDQMHELEERSSKLIDKMMSMEDSAKLVPTLQEEVTCYKKKNETLSKDFTAAIEILKDRDQKIVDLADLLATCEREKESSEVELSGAREMLEMQKYEKTSSPISSDNVSNLNSSDDTTINRLQEENNNLMKKVSELESSLCSREIEERLMRIGESKPQKEETVEAKVHSVLNEQIQDSKISIRMLLHRLLGVIAAPFVVVAVFLLTDLLVLSCPAPF